MKADYPSEWVPATPEYVLAGIQEEWRQNLLLDGADSGDVKCQRPTFATSIHDWRKAVDMVGWKPLGRVLDEQRGTRFPKAQWFEVLEPARFLGRECAAAGGFLAIRSLLVQAGAPTDLRPSTPLEPFLQKWPKVFLQEISRLSPGGLAFTRKQEFLTFIVGLSYILAALLTLVGWLAKDPWLPIAGMALFGLGWIGAGCGRWLPGALELESVTNFRELTKAIMTQQSRAGLGPVKSP